MNETAVQIRQSRFFGACCPMRSLNGLLGLGVALISVGCANPIRVYSYHGPGMQFDSNAETFSWLAAPNEKQRQIREEYASVDKQFRAFITEALAARGYFEADPGPPDVWLEYWFGRRVTGNPDQPGKDKRYALITFDVLEPDNLRLIWRSSAHVLVDRSAPVEDIRDLLRRTVEAMLNAVPPRSGVRGSR